MSRVTGLKDTDKVEEEMKELLKRMSIFDPAHTGAWRVGKKGNEGRGSSKERAFIIRFPIMEARKEFFEEETYTQEDWDLLR